MTLETRTKLVNAFNQRVKALKINQKSASFKKEQTAFFAGALTALEDNDVSFTIIIMSDRNILEECKELIHEQ